MTSNLEILFIKILDFDPFTIIVSKGVIYRGPWTTTKISYKRTSHQTSTEKRNIFTSRSHSEDLPYTSRVDKITTVEINFSVGWEEPSVRMVPETVVLSGVTSYVYSENYISTKNFNIV